MTAHEGDGPRAQRLSERAAERGGAHEHVAGAVRCGLDVEDRHAAAQERAHVVERPQRRRADAERDDRRRVVVHDRPDVRPRLVDLAVDEPFEVGGAGARIDRVRVEIVLHDVGHGDELGGERARHEVAARVAIVPRADVPVAVEHVLVRQDAVRGHQVLDESGVGRPDRGRRGLGGRGLEVGGGRREHERAAGHEPPSREAHHRPPPVKPNLRITR